MSQQRNQLIKLQLWFQSSTFFDSSFGKRQHRWMEECLLVATSGSKMYTVLVASLQIVCRKQHFTWQCVLDVTYYLFFNCLPNTGCMYVLLSLYLWWHSCGKWCAFNINIILSIKSKPVIQATSFYGGKRIRIKSFAAIAIKRHGRESKLVKNTTKDYCCSRRCLWFGPYGIAWRIRRMMNGLSRG